MGKYHTEGIVKEINLNDSGGSFRLESSPQYAFEEKSAGKTEKRMIFVADDRESNRQSAFLASSDLIFVFKQGKALIDTASLLILKQNRCRIRIVVNKDQIVNDKKKIKVSELMIQ